MPAELTPSALLADLARRGFTVRAVAGAISVSPASALTPGDRDAIRRLRIELLATLSPGVRWDTATALGLMEAADSLVERLGVDGRHPSVARAAAKVCAAHAAQGMGAVRLACRGFEAVVRGLAADRVRVSPRGDTAAVGTGR
jgi:hypothetical protein